MKIPAWLKPGVWGAVLGAILMAIVGFSQLGWRTASSADAFAAERASDAVVAAMVPFCVAKAQSDTDPAAMAAFKAEQSAYSRVDLVIKAGWATVGSATSADNALAQACSMKLFTMKSG
jgi:folate-dependent phosphoribosylglycinamide formyltransferase PurN